MPAMTSDISSKPAFVSDFCSGKDKKTDMNTYELYHHGILGQKWGIRRYQNKDGSLTAEGIKRYRTDLKFKEKYDKYSAKQNEKKAAKAREAEVKRVEKLMNKDTRKLTDEELAERIRRLDLEKRVNDLERSVGSSNFGNQQQRPESSGNKSIDAGKSFIKRAGADLLSTTTKLAVNYAAKKIMKGIFKDYTDDDKKDKDKDKKDKSDDKNNKWTDSEVTAKYNKATKTVTDYADDVWSSKPKNSTSDSVYDRFYDSYSKEYGDVLAKNYWTLNSTGESSGSFWSTSGSTTVDKLSSSTWYASGKDKTNNIIDSIGDVSIKSIGNYSDWFDSFDGGKRR